MKRLVCAAMLCCGSFAAPALAAGDCTLHEIAALKLELVADGSLATPITLDGKPVLFNFSVDDPFSLVKGAYADAAGFKRRPMPSGVTLGLGGGGQVTGLEIVPSFAVGNASGTDVQMLRAENSDFGDARVVGVLAMDILSNFDIEVDAANQAANLFTHDHCDDKLVYWPAERYAKVSYRTDPSGHPMFEMQLDGKTVIVVLSTHPGSARMSMAAAHRLLGMDETTPGLMPIANPASEEKQYRFPFKTLSVEGVTINNPAIMLVGSSTDKECRPTLSLAADGSFKKCLGGSDVQLGLQELRALHIFMATKEKMLYVTPAATSPGEPRELVH